MGIWLINALVDELGVQLPGKNRGLVKLIVGKAINQRVFHAIGSAILILRCQNGRAVLVLWE